LTLVIFPLGTGTALLPPAHISASLKSDPLGSLAGRSKRTLLKTEFSKKRPIEPRITVLPVESAL
jgi:hypothetical protein